MHYYFVIYKPYQVLCQFSPVSGKKTLKDILDFPPDVYPVGRLDYDSEGLLLLSNDPSLNYQLLQPRHGHEREYLVQVEGIPTEKALQSLRKGISISIDGKHYTCKPAEAELVEIVQVPERQPPVRFRKNIPTTWMRLILSEGKNRQVRKMTAATGFPTLRLIRTRIEKLELGNMEPGDVRSFSHKQINQLLFASGRMPASKKPTVSYPAKPGKRRK